MKNQNLIEHETTGAIIGAFYDVYYELGFGFLEHVYALALEMELQDRGCRVIRETPVAIVYKGRHLTTQRADMVVNDRVVVELKSTEALPPMAKRQLHNYLRATRLEVALLLHFGPQATFYRMIQTATHESG